MNTFTSATLNKTFLTDVLQHYTWGTDSWRLSSEYETM